MKKVFATTTLFILVTTFLSLPLNTSQAQSSSLSQQEISSLQDKINELTKLLLALQAQSSEHKPETEISFADCAQITVSWQPVENAQYYKLFRNGKEVYKGSQTSFTDTDLKRGQTYSYSISAGNSAGEGPRSSSRNITAINICPPRTPSNLEAQTGGCGGEVKLSWNPSAGAIKYELLRGNSVVYQGTAPSFTDTGLSFDRNYNYRLRAVGSTGLVTEYPETVQARSSEVCPPTAPEIQIPYFEEGYFEVNLLSTPTDSNSFKAGGDRNVMRFSIKAFDSDIKIERIDLSFNKRPWLYFDQIRLRRSFSTIYEITPTSEDFAQLSSDNFRLRMSGLNININKGQTRTFTLRVSSKELIPGGTPQSFRVYLNQNAIRGSDEVGLQLLEPTSGGGIEGDYSRKFTITGP